MDIRKIIHWAPRVLAILFILFISIFALDSFDGDASFWMKLGGFFMHLIPTYALIGATVLAWKKELTGGIVFVILSLIFTILFRAYNSIGTLLIITSPVLIIGILFVADNLLENKKTKQKKKKRENKHLLY